MARHHPNDGLLVAYAAGSLDEPLALLIATHLALCPDCRATTAGYEAFGGVLLDDLAPEAVSDQALARVFQRLDEAESAPARAAAGDPAMDASVAATVPQPLRGYLEAELAQLPWRSRGAVSEAELLTGFQGYSTKLMRIKPETAVPRHTHEGTEITLVLQGGFSDAAGHYERGDVAFADQSVNHQPVADPGRDCICLAVTDAPLRLTGPIGRFLNPFLRL